VAGWKFSASHELIGSNVNLVVKATVLRSALFPYTIRFAALPLLTKGFLSI
jgi:hypothetical protein